MNKKINLQAPEENLDKKVLKWGRKKRKGSLKGAYRILCWKKGF